MEGVARFLAVEMYAACDITSLVLLLRLGP